MFTQITQKCVSNSLGAGQIGLLCLRFEGLPQGRVFFSSPVIFFFESCLEFSCTKQAFLIPSGTSGVFIPLTNKHKQTSYLNGWKPQISEILENTLNSEEIYSILELKIV